MVETIARLHLQGSIFPDILRCCEMDFATIHSSPKREKRFVTELPLVRRRCVPCKTAWQGVAVRRDSSWLPQRNGGFPSLCVTARKGTSIKVIFLLRLPHSEPRIRIFLENPQKLRENGSGFWKERWLKRMEKESTLPAIPLAFQPFVFSGWICM